MNDLTKRPESGIETSGIFKFLGIVIVVMVIADLVSRFLRPTDTLLSQYIQAQTYAGVSDPRVVEATDKLYYLDLINEHPYTPWVSVNFVNDGPNSVWIAINQPTATYELKAGETASVYRIGAQERIMSIFFICNTGEEALVRVIGEY